MITSAQAHDLAAAWHARQEDKSGKPYVEHLERVASRFVLDSDEHIVALLHDCMEDQGITEEDLRKAGLTEEQILAIRVLSHIPKNEPNVVYWGYIKENPLALRVKLSDILDNMNPDRLYYLPKQDRLRMAKKYHHALSILLF